MPNRILKESICTSETIDRLTIEEENFFYRLIVNCDDYGRMDGRPRILLSKCYPLKEDITLDDIKRRIMVLINYGLVRSYVVNDQPYLQLVTWEKHQQIRAKRSKYPDPTSTEYNGYQMISDASTCYRNPIQSNPNPNPNPIIIGHNKESPQQQLTEIDKNKTTETGGTPETIENELEVEKSDSPKSEVSQPGFLLPTTDTYEEKVPSIPPDEKIILTPDEAAFIATLETVVNYPLDRVKDLAMYHELGKRYPTLDLLEAIKDWAIYKTDKPLKPGNNARSQINTSFKKNVEWKKNLKISTGPRSGKSSFSKPDKFADFQW